MTPALTAVAPGTAALILFGVFFVLMFLRVPVAVALALACLPLLLLVKRNEGGEPVDVAMAAE